MKISSPRAAAGAVLFATATALSLFALLGRAQADPPVDRPAAESLPRSIERARGAPLLRAQVDRGPLRTTQLFTSNGAVVSEAVVEASWEIDVTAITIQSGEREPAGPLGSFAIGPANSTTIISVIDYFAVRSAGTTHYQFDPPMPLRAGDLICWLPQMGSAGGLVQITLRGYEGGAVVSTGVTAR
jgi:hypothetical protein